jgi:DHA1 family multidrug resistance protein-like MFS transporter
MRSSNLFLAALLVAPSLSLITPLPIQSSTSATTWATTRATTRLYTVAGETVSRGGDGETDGQNDGAVSVAKKEKPLPREMMPITMGVFAQMLGEGIALSSLPLYLTRLGATPTSVGLAISCFSLAQMTFAPILVGLSSRIGRSIVLRICLAGAVASSLLIAFSGNVYGIVAGRTLAGVFAACVPVAQSGVTDMLSKSQTALGLSRVSAASQLGVVVGPAVSAIFQEGFAAMGLPAAKCLPAVFCLNSLFTLTLLVQMTLMNRRSVDTEEKAGEQQQQEEKKQDEIKLQPEALEQDTGVRFAQPMLRTITIAIGWTAILSNSIYGLFAPKFLNFSQPQLSATYSFAAAIMVGTQVVLPKLMAKLGEHRVCTLGILAAGAGIGGQSLVRFQPLHSMLYMMNRAGAAVADTSTATLVARASPNRDARSRNLALLTSTRAAGRIVTPLLSSKLFELSCRRSSILAPGALPFVIAAFLAIAVSPLPTVLNSAEKRQQRKSEKTKNKVSK